MFGEKFRQVVDAEVERLDGAMAYERERGTEELKRRAWARFGRQKWEWDKTDGLKVGSLLIELPYLFAEEIVAVAVKAAR